MAAVARGYPTQGYRPLANVYRGTRDFQRAFPANDPRGTPGRSGIPNTVSPQYLHELARPEIDPVKVGVGATARALGLLATRANPVLSAFQLGWTLGEQLYDFTHRPEWAYVGSGTGGMPVIGPTWELQFEYPENGPADHFIAGWNNTGSGISAPFADPGDYALVDVLPAKTLYTEFRWNDAIPGNLFTVAHYTNTQPLPTFHPETWITELAASSVLPLPVENWAPAAREAGPAATPLGRPSEVIATNAGTSYSQAPGRPVVAHRPGTRAHREMNPTRPRRPDRNTKEKKLVLGRAGVALRIFGHYTEGIDLVEALFDAIDWKKRQKDKVVGKIWGTGFETKYPGQKYWSVGAWRQARYVFTNFGAIDFGKALSNIVSNEIEDRVIGKAGQLANRVTKNKHWISPKGIGMGPTL